MFRGKTKSKMQKDQFGVGSVIVASRDRYLVVGNANSVRVVNLKSMELSQSCVSVEDMNFISESEAREICNLAEPQWTFTDFDIDPVGLKDLK